jgi:hypothetical protein
MRMATAAMTPPREFYWSADECAWVRCSREPVPPEAAEQPSHPDARLAGDAEPDVRSG